MKIISILMAVFTTISSLVSSGEILNINETGIPAITTDQVYFWDNLTGKSNYFDISIDDMTREICDYINENSTLDIEKIVTGLPDLNKLPRVITKVFNIDTVALREQVYSYHNKLLAENKTYEAKIAYFLGAYLTAFRSCDIYLDPIENSDEYEFILDVTYEDGEVGIVNTGIFYDSSTKRFHGSSDKGMADIGYEFDMKEMVVYATVNCWMRNFGFCLGYDIVSYILPLYFYNTRRIRFDYADKEWMIQVWKGNYVITNGSEVGIYNRDKIKAGTYYDCAKDEDMLKMSMQLYHNDELIIDLPEQYHWWINGFKLSDTLYPAKSLTVKFTIEMKDEEMLQAFTDAVDKNIYHDISYSVDGLKVSLSW